MWAYSRLVGQIKRPTPGYLAIRRLGVSLLVSNLWPLVAVMTRTPHAMVSLGLDDDGHTLIAMAQSDCFNDAAAHLLTEAVEFAGIVLRLVLFISRGARGRQSSCGWRGCFLL